MSLTAIGAVVDSRSGRRIDCPSSLLTDIAIHDTRQNPANRPGLLALENVAERRRAGTLHRARLRSTGARGDRGPTESSSAGGTGLPRYPGGAGVSLAQRRPLRQHAGDRVLSRPDEAVLHRRHPRDGQPSPVSLLGPPDRGLAYRTAAERG